MLRLGCDWFDVTQYYVLLAPETYLSIMTPSEWGVNGAPHEFLGSYRHAHKPRLRVVFGYQHHLLSAYPYGNRLEADMTWTRIENIPSPAAMERMLDTLNLKDPRLLQAIAPACATDAS